MPLPTVADTRLACRSRHTPLHKVKAVIVGQDPYHNHNQAHGLAFSVRPPTPAPPSLVNIYTGIKNDYPSFERPPNKGGLLIPWAERGVLMLNTCLTVRAHQAGSHANKGWERFTQKAIDIVARVRTNGVVFLAWGNPAGKRVSSINRQKHCVLQSVHPSPLSASRGFVSAVSAFLRPPSPRFPPLQYRIWNLDLYRIDLMNIKMNLVHQSTFQEMQRVAGGAIWSRRGY